jgi:hypothetical protein
MAYHTRTTKITRQPDTPAPRLYCPSCGIVLTFIETISSGVPHPEHWDRHACRGCGGNFEYRRRTRTLRRTN